MGACVDLDDLRHRSLRFDGCVPGRYSPVPLQRIFSRILADLRPEFDVHTYIEFGSKDKGRGKAVQDRRIIVIVRRDQNANCQPEASDPVVSKASVAVELHNSSDVLVGIESGKTDNDGTYTTKQFKSLADSSYSIWVTGLSHDTYVWDQALDIANPAYVTVTH